MKRNRFIKLTGATKTINRELEAKTRDLAGWKRYTTNLTGQIPEFVIGAYHQLRRIEKSFRMSKHDLQAGRSITTNANRSTPTSRPYSPRWPSRNGSSTKPAGASRKFVRTARRHRNVTIKAGNQILTSTDPLPNELSEALAKISNCVEH